MRELVPQTRIRFNDDEEFRRFKHAMRRSLLLLGYTSASAFVRDVALALFRAGQKDPEEAVEELGRFFASLVERAKSRVEHVRLQLELEEKLLRAREEGKGWLPWRR